MIRCDGTRNGYKLLCNGSLYKCECGHVGCKQSKCFNHKTDVELVKFLIAQHRKNTPFKKLTLVVQNLRSQ